MVFERRFRTLLIVILAAFAVWLPCAVGGVAGQREAFFGSGAGWTEGRYTSDFGLPRATADIGYSAPDEDVPVFDRCYPAFAVRIIGLFPRSRTGAIVWTLSLLAVYLSVLCVACRSPIPLFALTFAPVLHNLSSGNSVALAAACSAVFLALYRSESWKGRILAACALGTAAALKLIPALLGVLYLRDIFSPDAAARKRAFGLAVFAASVFAVLFVLPFGLMPDGFGGMRDFWHNALANGDHYCVRAAFGFGPIARTGMILLGRSWKDSPEILSLLQDMSMIYGIAVLFWGAWRRDRLLVVIGMMLAARNMMTYGLLYLIPVFFLEGNRWRRIDLLAFFILFVPLQIVWIRFGYVYSANPFLVNVMLLFLPFLRQLSPLSERTRRNQDESYQQPGELSTAPSTTQPKGNTDMNKKEITEKRNKLQGDCG